MSIKKCEQPKLYRIYNHVQKQKITEISINATQTMFNLRTCPSCDALRDTSEKDLCCLKGKRLVTPEMFPAWDPEFNDIVRRHAVVLRES